MNQKYTNGAWWKLRRKSDGSAITEFLIFTLPFFAVLLAITINVYQESIARSEAKNLARQTVRAFISSPTNELAEIRANQVLDIYIENLSSQDLENRSFELNITCTNNPCLSPGGKVTSSLEVLNAGSQARRIIATATEYVDLWR
jgi:hypothetical protein